MIRLPYLVLFSLCVFTFADKSLAQNQLVSFSPNIIDNTAQAAQNEKFRVTNATTRIWLENGSTRWSHCMSARCGGDSIYGDLTSKLEYDKLQQYSSELEITRPITQYSFLLARAQVGFVNDGTLRDRDYYNTGLSFRDTLSDIKTGNWISTGIYGGFWGNKEAVEYQIYTGLNIAREELKAYGIRCQTPETGSDVCQALSSDIRVIRNHITWYEPAVGVSAKTMISDKLNALMDFEFSPYAYFSGEDSHYSDSNLNGDVSFKMTGHGRALTTKLGLSYQLSERMNLEAIMRNQRRWAKDQTIARSPNFDAKYPLRTLESERTGIAIGVTIKL